VPAQSGMVGTSMVLLVLDSLGLVLVSLSMGFHSFGKFLFLFGFSLLGLVLSLALLVSPLGVLLFLLKFLDLCFQCLDDLLFLWRRGIPCLCLVHCFEFVISL